jgi:hypothetical protein
MATELIASSQSLKEIRTYFVDFTDDLPTGVTVSSATATHTPPSGDASTPVVVSTHAPIIEVTLGPLTVTGVHYLSVLATLSDTEKSEVKLTIPVNW